MARRFIDLSVALKAGIASESLPLDRVAQRILVELGR